MPVELDGLQQWGVGDRMLRDLLAGRTPDDTLAKEWRRGVLPPGRLGWRLANKLLEQAAAGGRAGRHPAGRTQPRGARRLLRPRRRTVADRHRHRRLRRAPRARQLLARRAQALARRVDPAAGPVRHPADPWLLGRSGRSGREGPARGAGRPVRSGRVGLVSPRPPTSWPTWSRSTTPGWPSRCRCPLKSCFAWAEKRRSPEAARRRAAAYKWASDRYPGEDADPEQVLVWGASASLDRLLEASPLDGEEWEGETTRLGALSCRIWAPMMDRVHL